ncbi:MAG: ABC transporter permease [Armatimonadota bacterium]
MIRYIINYISKVFVIVEMEARRLSHDYTEIFTRAIQPALWLVIFGEVFSRYKIIPTGNMSYLDYITPGILSQSVLFIAIFYGILIVWERDLGLLSKLIVSPAPRSAIVLGKALSSSIKCLAQAVVVLILAIILKVKIIPNPLYLMGVFGVVILSATCFASLSIFIASSMKTRERFMGIGQVLTMPLFFASNALYPLSAMPDWIKFVSIINPVTYMVSALRSLLITGDLTSLPFDVSILLIITVAFVTFASISFRTILE